MAIATVRNMDNRPLVDDILNNSNTNVQDPTMIQRVIVNMKN